jgi:hypothetical protein
MAQFSDASNPSKSKSDAARAENLPPEQTAALELLLAGRTVVEAAQATGVNRKTIHRWLKNDPAFQAAYNEWQEQMKETCRSRLLVLTDKATAAVEKALENGDAKSAMQLLKEIGLLAPMAARPTDEQEVRKAAELAAKRRRTEHDVAEARMRSDLKAALEEEKMW